MLPFASAAAMATRQRAALTFVSRPDSTSSAICSSVSGSSGAMKQRMTTIPPGASEFATRSSTLRYSPGHSNVDKAPSPIAPVQGECGRSMVRQSPRIARRSGRPPGHIRSI